MGERILRAAWLGTAVFCVAELAAVASETFLIPAAVVSIALFVAGCAAYIWGYATAVGRSRRDAIDLAGLFFLTGTAPKRVRLQLLGAAALQVVVAITAASIRPGTAAGILAPVFGGGLCAVWAARYGRFPSRTRK